ncbi:hypothetical protein WA158_004782 [Blastocystis sp. Blastoise]
MSQTEQTAVPPSLQWRGDPSYSENAQKTHSMGSSSYENSYVSSERQRSPGSEKSYDIRVGDWFCSNCQTHNFGTRMECRKCGSLKGASEVVTESRMSSGKSEVPKQPDWDCPNCRNHNYGFRNECHLCKKPRPEPNPWSNRYPPSSSSSSSSPSSQYPHSYYPPSRPTTSYSPPSSYPPPRPIDRYNERPVDRYNERPINRYNDIPMERSIDRYNDRPSDRYIPRPVDRYEERPMERTVERYNTSTFDNKDSHGSSYYDISRGKKGDWICTNCSDVNFSYRDVCRKCHAPKPAVIMDPKDSDRFRNQNHHEGSRSRSRSPARVHSEPKRSNDIPPKGTTPTTKRFLCCAACSDLCTQRCVHVFNLPVSVTIDQITELFSKVGEIDTQDTIVSSPFNTNINNNNMNDDDDEDREDKHIYHYPPIQIINNDNDNHDVQAFITYKDASVAHRALYYYNNYEYNNCHLYLSMAERP